MAKYGTLFLIPNTLGPTESGTALYEVIPSEVQKQTSQLEFFIVENAKSARAFLKIVNANYPLAKKLQEIQMSELNVNTKDTELTRLLEPLIAGHDVGLLSEAGVPAVADPGANLVRLAHRKNVPVKPLVGPSSILLAIMASGLNGQSFAFNGYLPTDINQRQKKIKELEARSKKENQTQIFIETPYRNIALLEAFATFCEASTSLTVATHLTLPDESIHTHSITTWREKIRQKYLMTLQNCPTIFAILGTSAK